MVLLDATPSLVFEYWDINDSVQLENNHSYLFNYKDADVWKDNWPLKKWSLITRRHLHERYPEIIVSATIWHWKYHMEQKNLCAALIYFTDYINKSSNRTIYNITAINPLTIKEKIVCGHCGDSGYIKQGKWLCA